MALSPSLEISQDFGPVPATKGGPGNTDVGLQVARDNSAKVDWERSAVPSLEGAVIFK